MMRLKNVIMGVAAAMVVLASGVASAQVKDPVDWSKAKPEAVKAWQDMRFGMFIHWGPVSLTGHEIGWSRGKETPIDKYDSLYKEFNPVKFNADEWVATAKAAGMKYIVLTAKHHDGFCLWDTALTDYNIMNSPFKRDVVKELASACKNQGIKFGTYYSTCDWYHPGWPVTSPGGKGKREKSDLDAYQKYLLGQIRELITNYGPLVTIWNDVPQMYGARGADTIKMVRELQPDILINDRTGAGGDYSTPEQRIGGFQMDGPWETCMTICQQWAWKPNDSMKSLKQCLDTLVLTAAGDGNLLFNVGPQPDGLIEARQVERLKEMGAWLDKYGDTIYGTRGGPYVPTEKVACTRKDDSIFLHILRWEGDTVTLPALPAKIVSSTLLTGGDVKVVSTADSLIVTVPEKDQQAIDTIVKLQLDTPAINIPPLGEQTSARKRKKR